MMIHKFRRAMVNASREPLHGVVGLDDTWIGGTQAGLRGSRQLKGRKAALVMVAVEKRTNQLGAFAWRSFRTSRPHPAFFPEETCPAGAIVYTDGLKSYVGLQEAGYKYVPRIQPSRSALRKGIKSVVPLADRAIGNLHQWLIGTYHGVSKDQLQVYLDESAFRHNPASGRWRPSQNAPRPRGRPPADRIQANPGSSRPFRKEWAGWAATTDCAQLSRPDKQETSSRLRNKGSDEPKSPQTRQCPNAESTTGILLLAVTSFVSGDEHSTISHTFFFQQRLPDYGRQFKAVRLLLWLSTTP